MGKKTSRTEKSTWWGDGGSEDAPVYKTVISDGSKKSEAWGRTPEEAQKRASNKWDQGERGPVVECFIAGVVYDNPNAPQVQTLREYRDNVLRRSFIGRGIINLYYSGVGKTAAYFIEAYMPFAIPNIRSGLDHFVEAYSGKDGSEKTAQELER